MEQKRLDNDNFQLDFFQNYDITELPPHPPKLVRQNANDWSRLYDSKNEMEKIEEYIMTKFSKQTKEEIAESLKEASNNIHLFEKNIKNEKNLLEIEKMRSATLKSIQKYCDLTSELFFAGQLYDTLRLKHAEIELSTIFVFLCSDFMQNNPKIFADFLIFYKENNCQTKKMLYSKYDDLMDKLVDIVN